MEQAFGLVVRFKLQQGAAAAFDALTAETLAEITEREPDTVLYVVTQAADDPDTRVFFEVYRDRVAFDHHEAQPHTRRFLEERGQYLLNVDVSFLSVTGAKGLEEAAGDSSR